MTRRTQRTLDLVFMPTRTRIWELVGELGVGLWTPAEGAVGRWTLAQGTVGRWSLAGASRYWLEKQASGQSACCRVPEPQLDQEPGSRRTVHPQTHQHSCYLLLF